MRRIKTNRAKCAQCGDVIESKTVHDFVECSCGSIFVDGGREYLRRGWTNEALFVELSEFEKDDDTA